LLLARIHDGIIKEFWDSDEIKRNIIQKTTYAEPGDRVWKFNGSNHTIGTMILKFDTAEEILHKMEDFQKGNCSIIEFTDIPCELH